MVKLVEGDALGSSEPGGGHVEDLAVLARSKSDNLPYREVRFGWAFELSVGHPVRGTHRLAAPVQFLHDRNLDLRAVAKI
ncbi:hypothetical protein [Kribbella sp. VKM Ac-2566]|uniref:hypothetical protein n=1 Tax=Kribbella sp. VKM Ac-2566 TaxID=2512218 RepID=UPI001062D241|nr:hypothetical protein [Kribbella sp. VKM Ac-2566]